MIYTNADIQKEQILKDNKTLQQTDELYIQAKKDCDYKNNNPDSKASPSNNNTEEDKSESNNTTTENDGSEEDSD